MATTNGNASQVPSEETGVRRDEFGNSRFSPEQRRHRGKPCDGNCQQKISQLRTQLKAAVEELKAERKRHGSTLENLQQSQQDLFAAKRQLDQYQQTQMDDIYRRRVAALDFYHQQYERDQQIKQQQQLPWQNAGRQTMLTVGGPDVVEDGVGRDTTDPPTVPRNFPYGYDVLAPLTSYMTLNDREEPVPAAASSTVPPSGTESVDEEDSRLHCPHCDRTFESSDTQDFLAHAESCAK